MPNHVTNILKFRGEDERLKKIFEDIKNDEIGAGSISFEKIIPMPDYIYRGNLGKDEMEKYGENNWYDFSVANWGTKWNAYGFNYLLEEREDDEIRFLTAWAAPVPVIDKLSQLYPDVAIEHEWADEALGQNCGRHFYEEGERKEVYYPESYKDCLEFGARIQGIPLEEIPVCTGLYLNADETDYIDISKRAYDLANVNGTKCLITSDKLKMYDIPKGLFCYDICRDTDDVTIRKASTTGVVGTLITKVKLLLGAENRMLFDGSVILGERLTMENFLTEE